MFKRYGKKLLWGILYVVIGYILNTFLYPIILAFFSAFLGTETVWINLIPAWPGIVFWIVAYNFRINRPEMRREYLASLGEQRPGRKETWKYVFRMPELMLDFLAFLTILFFYLLSILIQTQSLGLCMFFFWIYIPLYAVTDALSWFLVHRYWQRSKY